MSGVRYAIYARYSSDLQSPKSIDDQVVEARAKVAQLGGDPDTALIVTDYAESGHSLDRPGAQQLLQLIKREAFDVLVTEAPNRIARAADEAIYIRKLCRFHNVDIVGLDGTNVREGHGELEYDIKSMMADGQLRDISQKTLRGLQGRARAGKATGGVAYGYRLLARTDEGSTIEVHPEQSRVIKRIFRDYLSGHSFASIAHALNDEGVQPPRAHSKRSAPGWMGSAVRAMLINPRYTGEWNFGTRQWVKPPKSKKRKKRMRRTGPLVKMEHPELAIVDREAFDAVQARFQERMQDPATKKRADYMLSGLLRCSLCGGNMTCVGGATRRYGCARRKNGGASVCSNGTTVRIPDLESAILEKTQRRLTDRMPEIQAMFVEELKSFLGRIPNHRKALDAQIKDLKARALRLVDDVETGKATATTRERLQEVEASLEKAKTELASLSTKATPVLPSPALITRRIRELGKLSEGPADVGRERLRYILANGTITCTPRADGSYEATWIVIPDVLLAQTEIPARGSLGRVSRSGCGGVIPQLDTRALGIPCKALISRKVA